MQRAAIVPPSIVNRPMARGNENRRGPAEPGLNNSVSPYRSIVGRWLWPKTQTEGRSRSNQACASFAILPFS
jgi:hypothetical protein